VWEQLNRIDGDTAMCGPDFIPYVAEQTGAGTGADDVAGEGMPVDYGEL
jgi:hypothetical protein